MSVSMITPGAEPPAAGRFKKPSAMPSGVRISIVSSLMAPHTSKWTAVIADLRRHVKPAESALGERRLLRAFRCDAWRGGWSTWRGKLGRAVFAELGQEARQRQNAAQADHAG